jgi:hypothetical protein
VTPDSTAPAFAALTRKPDLTVVPTPGTEESAPAAPAGTDSVVPTGTGWHRPRGTDPGAVGTSVSVPPSVPVVPTLAADLVPMLAETARAGARVRLTRWARAWVAEFADYQRRHRTFPHAVAVFITRPPETWAQTAAHLETRKWLQEWMTGRFRWFCEWENVAWGHLVARPGKTALRLAEKVFFERQIGFWLALGFIGLCVLIRML